MDGWSGKSIRKNFLKIGRNEETLFERTIRLKRRKTGYYIKMGK